MLRDASGRSHGAYDLIVAADGSASKLRAMQARRDRQYPWGAVWCLCPDPQRRFDGQLWQRYERARRMAGVLPVGHLPGEARTQHRVSFFWSLPLAAMDGWRSRGLPEWKNEVRQYWPEVADLLTHIHEPDQLARASYRDVIMTSPWRGRAIWIGDAAHAMSPQLGQGANLALLDAQVLAAALRDAPNLAQALAAYARLRRRHVYIYQFISRWLTPVFQSDLDWAANLRDLAFGPLGRMPIARGEMLKVLAGIKRGWFGTLRLTQPRTNTPSVPAQPTQVPLDAQDSGGT